MRRKHCRRFFEFWNFSLKFTKQAFTWWEEHFTLDVLFPEKKYSFIGLLKNCSNKFDWCSTKFLFCFRPNRKNTLDINFWRKKALNFNFKFPRNCLVDVPQTVFHLVKSSLWTIFFLRRITAAKLCSKFPQNFLIAVLQKNWIVFFSKKKYILDVFFWKKTTAL